MIWSYQFAEENTDMTCIHILRRSIKTYNSKRLEIVLQWQRHNVYARTTVNNKRQLLIHFIIIITTVIIIIDPPQLYSRGSLKVKLKTQSELDASPGGPETNKKLTCHWSSSVSYDSHSGRTRQYSAHIRRLTVDIDFMRYTCCILYSRESLKIKVKRQFSLDTSPGGRERQVWFCGTEGHVWYCLQVKLCDPCLSVCESRQVAVRWYNIHCVDKKATFVFLHNSYK